MGASTSTRRHLVLLGDSTIDNGNWTTGPCVLDQVREMEPETSMVAKDGALIAAIRGQLKRAPISATHYIVSVGGNNATGATTTVLGDACVNAEEAIQRLHTFVMGFENQFAAEMDALVTQIGQQKNIVICSCYNPCFGPFQVNTVSQSVANTTIALLADAVVRVATRLGVPVIDWRRVMTKVEDFANPIEPSSLGGAKIARTIVDVVRNHPFESRTTVIYPKEYPASDLILAAAPSPEALAAQGLRVSTSVLDEDGTAAVAAHLRGEVG